MSRRLPPLNAVRAFEAAARHLSVTRAAEELHVTQAAVSHQLRALEDQLGMALFRRAGRGIVLTEEGQILLAGARDALDHLAETVARLRRVGEEGALMVTTVDSFASGWLIPRLRRFRSMHPDVDVRVTTTDEVLDFARDGVDIAIRYGKGDWSGLSVERLMEEDLFPVCSPALLEGEHPLRTPADLKHHTLLHDDLTLNWAAWLRAAGVEGIDAGRGPFFTHSNLVIQAAVTGAGVALGRSALVGRELAEGSLVKPFELSLPAEYAHYVVCPPEYLSRGKVAAFRDWLFEEAEADRAEAAA